MNSSLKWIALISAAVLSGVLLVALLVNPALAQGPASWGRQGGYGWGGYGPGGMMGGGMMGPGMMGGWRGMGPGMMGGYGPGTGSRLTLDQAAEAVEQYLAVYGNSDPSAGSGQALALAEVMEFTDNFYAEVEEQSTGIHALELLINPYTGAIYPEPGPNMMWNTKYGHMGGRWGYGSQPPTADMPVSAEQARGYAQQYLDSYLPGTTADDHADAFYGYYTLHVLRDGQIVGMLSVNGVTGQVWYHTWHGDFIGMTDGHGE